MRRQVKNLAIIALLIGAANVCFGSEFLRDPTRPYEASAPAQAATSRFTVNVIIVSDDRRVAIVNGRRVSVGETVDGATVISIDKHQLVLEKDGTRITARLNDGARRQ